MQFYIYWEQLKRSFAVMKKNVRIYYYKGPVVIFGLLMPFFLFLAFSMGRNIPIDMLFPGLLGMTVFFTATSVGPVIVAFETRTKTLERLVSTAISLWAIFIGDVLSSFLYGIMISTVPMAIALVIGVNVIHPLILSVGVILAAFCFSSFSILLSAYPPTDLPATVMMLTSLVKFPLVFISGVFIPIEEMPEWGRIIASVSPLTYFTDVAKYSIQGTSYYPISIDLAILVAFTIFFLVTAIKLHEKTLQKRLS